MLRPIFHSVRYIALLVFATVVVFAIACSSQRSTHQISGPPDASNSQIKTNINTASATELQALPGVGPSLADKIVEHRTLYGPFRKTQHLLLIEGISEKRFEAIRDLISVD